MWCQGVPPWVPPWRPSSTSPSAAQSYRSAAVILLALTDCPAACAVTMLTLTQSCASKLASPASVGGWTVQRVSSKGCYQVGLSLCHSTAALLTTPAELPKGLISNPGLHPPLVIRVILCYPMLRAFCLDHRPVLEPAPPSQYRRCARLWVVVQGYGLTETCAASFLAGPFPGHSGTVGPPVPGTEYRLEGSSELGYAAVHSALIVFLLCIMM